MPLHIDIVTAAQQTRAVRTEDDVAGGCTLTEAT